jgi:sugar phosphate permease
VLLLIGSGFLLSAVLLPPFALLFPYMFGGSGPFWIDLSAMVMLIFGVVAAIFGLRSLWVLVGWVDAGGFPRVGESVDISTGLLARGVAGWGWAAATNAFWAVKELDSGFLAVAMISIGFAVVLTVAWSRARGTGSRVL